MDNLFTMIDFKEEGRGIAFHRWYMKKWFLKGSMKDVWNPAEYGNQNSMNCMVNL